MLQLVSMNAQLAARVIDAVNTRGLSPKPIAIEAITGRKTLVVARLEVSSVKNIINPTEAKTRIIKPKRT